MKYELMNERITQISHLFINPFIKCVQCTILVCEMYKLQVNEFCTIFIIKSWDVKFVMYVLSFPLGCFD
jgi:hypothetical protein